MRYFIEDVRIYKNVNKKGEDLQEYVTPLMQYLVADEASLEVLEKDIVNQIEWLNKIYHRQRPLVLDVSRYKQGRVWTIWVQGDSDKIAAMIYIKNVRGDIDVAKADGLYLRPDESMPLPMKPKGKQL